MIAVLWSLTKITKSQLFFVAQGPLVETVDDFWLVVRQQKVSVIAMLTQVAEDDRFRCAAYWPQSVGQTLSIQQQSVVDSNTYNKLLQ